MRQPLSEPKGEGKPPARPQRQQLDQDDEAHAGVAQANRHHERQV
jgi:hypothetical protein